MRLPVAFVLMNTASADFPMKSCKDLLKSEDHFTLGAKRYAIMDDDDGTYDDTVYSEFKVCGCVGLVVSWSFSASVHL